MSKTKYLRKAVKAKLDTVASAGESYYKQAAPDAVFPYQVFSFQTVNLADLSRDTYMMNVDVYDRMTSTTAIDDLADDIEAAFNTVNDPQTHILPTFYRETRMPIEESDKTIQHVRLTFSIQNYER